MTRDLIIGILLTLNSCMTFYIITRMNDPIVIQCTPYYELVEVEVEVESKDSCSIPGLKQK